MSDSKKPFSLLFTDFDVRLNDFSFNRDVRIDHVALLQSFGILKWRFFSSLLIPNERTGIGSIRKIPYMPTDEWIPINEKLPRTANHGCIDLSLLECSTADLSLRIITFARCCLVFSWLLRNSQNRIPKRFPALRRFHGNANPFAKPILKNEVRWHPKYQPLTMLKRDMLTVHVYLSSQRWCRAPQTLQLEEAQTQYFFGLLSQLLALKLLNVC